MTKRLLILFGIILLTACGPKQEEQAPTPPPQPQIPQSDDTFSNVLKLPSKRPARAELTPPEVKMGDLKPGEKAQKVVIFSNTGQTPLKIKGMRNTGNNDKIDITGSCKQDITIEPGQGCDLTIDFKGGDIGTPVKGEVIFFHDGDNSPTFLPITVEVVAPVTAPAAPAAPEPEATPAALPEPVVAPKAEPAPPPKRVEEPAPPKIVYVKEKPKLISPATPYMPSVGAISQRRSSTGIKIHMAEDALQDELGPPIVQPKTKDVGYNRTDLMADDGAFPKTTSTLAVDRSRIITSDRHIPAVLETAINSSFAGRVVAVVERNIYGSDGRLVLIPAGSRVLGQAPSSGGGANPRIEITWSRIILPNGASIAIDFSTADAMGQSGAVGHVEKRYIEKYGIPLLVSAITGTTRVLLSSKQTGVSVVGTDTVTQTSNSPRQQAIDDLTQKLSDTVTKAIEENTDAEPILIISAGTRIYIVPTRDIYLRDPETITVAPTGTNRSMKDKLSDLAVERTMGNIKAWPDRYGFSQPGGNGNGGDQLQNNDNDRRVRMYNDDGEPDRPNPNWNPVLQNGGQNGGIQGNGNGRQNQPSSYQYPANGQQGQGAGYPTQPMPANQNFNQDSNQNYNGGANQNLSRTPPPEPMDNVPFK